MVEGSHYFCYNTGQKEVRTVLKFPCLVLDHDDTVVRSEETVNYPYFCEILDQLRPGTAITLKEYTEGCYHQGFTEMCRQKYQFTDEELAEEYRGWKAYVRDHIPAPFPGMEEIILRQKALGGLVCVVSHSTRETIIRDYLTHFGLQPDDIYGWDLPEHKRKPAPFPLVDIMKKYRLSPADLLVVDDMKPAWEMARKVLTPIAFAAWGRQNYPEIMAEMTELCDYTFHKTEQLYRFLFEE